MTHLRQLSLSLAVAALGFATPLLAQERSAVSGAELDAAVVAHPTGNAATVQAFLATDQAREVAGRMGLSQTELATVVATLDQASLAQLAQRTDEALAGGSNTIVISATTVIIALLLIILLTR